MSRLGRLAAGGGILALFLCPFACSNGNGGSYGGGPPALGCQGGFDAGAGFLSGPVSESVDGYCGGSAITGTKAAGAACQSSGDCAPVCCACATGAHSANVSWCNSGVCATSNDVCCVFQYVQATDFNGDAGPPGVCSRP